MSGKNYGIDLGTGNIKIYSEQEKKIQNEKNILAIKNKNQAFSFGNQAYEIYEKAPSSILTVFPVKKGVISDVNNMIKIFLYFLDRINRGKKVNRGNYYFAVPTDVTNVEKRAFPKLILESKIKFRRIYVVEKPLADAVGCGIDIHDNGANFFVNIGADTTEISIISGGGIIVSKIIHIGGNSFNKEIQKQLDKEKKIYVGVKTAETLKIKLGGTEESDDNFLMINGQDNFSGIPSPIKISSDFINKSIRGLIEEISHQIGIVMDRIPPDLRNDLIQKGLFLTGGSANLQNIDRFISEHTGLKVTKPVSPEETVVRGLKIIMADSGFSHLKKRPDLKAVKKQ